MALERYVYRPDRKTSSLADIYSSNLRWGTPPSSLPRRVSPLVQQSPALQAIRRKLFACLKHALLSPTTEDGEDATPSEGGRPRPHWKLKTVSTLVLGFAVVLGANAAQVDLGYSAGFTPYDPYMRPVRQVLGNIDGESSSMERVRTLMRQGRNFRYSYTQPHVASLPELTEARQAGDCKDKALWLADRMGDENVRFVVGKARRTSSMRHAWLLWRNEGRWWILDCTYNYCPVAADLVSDNEYIPLYSWSKNGVYRHSSTRILTANSLAHRGR